MRPPIIFCLSLVVCFVNIVQLILASKKPLFCDQSREPFSFLWRIKGDPPSYLFGTIHVPYTKVWNHIPENAKQAFASSSQVYFELDLVNPTTVSALSSCQMLPQGKNLSDVLPGDLYSRLKRHLEYVRGMMPHWMTADQRGRGLYADYLFNAIAGNWERKRPVWIMLMVNSLTESDVRWRGIPVLDLYLAQEAHRMNKKTAAVERVEEQCLPLNGLNFTQVLFALNHTLLQHELRENEPSYTTDDLIRHYNCGDLSAGQQDTLPTLSGNSSLSEEEAALATNIDAYFRQELIYNRNMRMGKRVAHLLRHNPQHTLFFAFGAGHFLGNNTVLDFVQAQGFEIEHLSITAKIPKSSKSKKSVNSIGEKRKVTPLPTRKGQKRRSNRYKSLTSLGSPQGLQYIFDTSTPTPATTTRHFNDLWVRLEPTTFNRKKASFYQQQTSPQLSLQKLLQKERQHVQANSFASAISSIIALTVISQLLIHTQSLTGIT